MRFAIFTAGRPGWALTNVSVSLAAGLAVRGHEVDLVTLEEERESLLGHYRDVEGVEKVSVSPLGVRRLRASLPPLVGFLRSRKPDVMFSQLVLCNAIAVLARWLSRTRTKLFLLEGTMISRVGTIETNGSPVLRYAPHLVRLLYPLADGIVAKSPAVLEDLRRLMGRRGDRVHLEHLPNPYVLHRIRTLAREEAVWPWGPGESGPVLLSVGRLAPEKAFDVLIRAFARVRAARSCRLVVLGEGPERARLEGLADELGVRGDLALPGSVANPWKYMRRADFFVLPSRWEGWSSALTEAAALGCAIVASDRAVAGGGWLESGKSAVLVPADDVEALSQALQRLIDDVGLRERLGGAARTASERYDYRSVAGAYERFATGQDQGLPFREKDD